MTDTVLDRLVLAKVSSSSALICDASRLVACSSILPISTRVTPVLTTFPAQADESVRLLKRPGMSSMKREAAGSSRGAENVLFATRHAQTHRAMPSTATSTFVLTLDTDLGRHDECRFGGGNSDLQESQGFAPPLSESAGTGSDRPRIHVD